MGLNNPIPRSVGKEARKAAKVLSSFIKPNQVLGQDQVIPPEVLRNAKGLAIITVLKAGFLFSGRAGSGIVVARLPDGHWSAPSAIMTAGAGAGGQIGAEITDFVFILNNQAAVDSFSQLGSVTLGGNVSLAAGPLGRNAEAAGSASLKSVAAVFAYSKTKGLFAGVSLEGSVIVERRDANRKFYGPSATAKMILSGRVEAPPECDPLFRILETRAFRSPYADEDDDFYGDIPSFADDSDSVDSGRRGSNRNRRGYDDYDDDDDDDDYGNGRGPARRNGRGSSSARVRGSTYDNDDDDYAAGRNRSRQYDEWDDDFRRYSKPKPSKSSSWEDDYYDEHDSGARRHFRSTYSDNPSPQRPQAPKPRYNGNGSSSAPRRFDADAPKRYDEAHQRKLEEKGRLEAQLTAAATGRAPAAPTATALFTFEGEQSGDLPFRKGDVITIVKRTDSVNDWWTGRIGNQQGIFPANYVQIS